MFTGKRRIGIWIQGDYIFDVQSGWRRDQIAMDGPGVFGKSSGVLVPSADSACCAMQRLSDSSNSVTGALFPKVGYCLDRATICKIDFQC